MGEVEYTLPLRVRVARADTGTRGCVGVAGASKSAPVHAGCPWPGTQSAGLVGEGVRGAELSSQYLGVAAEDWIYALVWTVGMATWMARMWKEGRRAVVRA